MTHKESQTAVELLSVKQCYKATLEGEAVAGRCWVNQDPGIDAHSARRLGAGPGNG